MNFRFPCSKTDVAANFSLSFSTCCVIDNNNAAVEGQKNAMQLSLGINAHIRPFVVTEHKKRDLLLMLADTALSESTGDTNSCKRVT